MNVTGRTTLGLARSVDPVLSWWILLLLSKRGGAAFLTEIRSASVEFEPTTAKMIARVAVLNVDMKLWNLAKSFIVFMFW